MIQLGINTREQCISTVKGTCLLLRALVVLSHPCCHSREMSSASSSTSAGPSATSKAARPDNYISQFLRRPFQDDKNSETPLFYSTLEEGRTTGQHTIDASGDSMHGLGRDAPVVEAEEDSPFMPSQASRRAAQSVTLLDDSLYSHSEASALPLPKKQPARQTAGGRIHQQAPLGIRPSSSMSNKASDVSHFVGQSVLLSSPETSPPAHAFDLSRSESDDLLSALKAPQIPSDSPPPDLSRFDKPSDAYLDRQTLHIQEGEVQAALHIQAHDSGWLAIYLSCVTATGAIAIYAYLFANPPYELSSPTADLPLTEDTEVEEAASLLSILPLLTSLTLLSILGASCAIGYMMLVQKGVRRMVYGLLIGGPTGLIMLSFWSWGFSWQEEAEQGNEARWVCFVAAILAAICVRMTWKRKDRIERTVQVIEVGLGCLLHFHIAQRCC